MSTISLPYYAPSADLHEPLPNRDVISNSSEVIKGERFGCKVVGVGLHYVVKHGPKVDLREGKVMLFLADKEGVRVPKVYALYEEGEEKFNVMERVRGKTLRDVWDDLTEDAKESLTTRLQATWTIIRSLSSPGGFCAVDGSLLPCTLLHLQSGALGPFMTEDEFSAGLLTVYSSPVQTPDTRTGFIRRALSTVFRGHPPVFSHGNIHRRNIMVTNADGLDKLELVIIDWEAAGWYPSYWEYTLAMSACGNMEDDWNSWVDRILEPFYMEFGWMNTLITEMLY